MNTTPPSETSAGQPAETAEIEPAEVMRSFFRNAELMVEEHDGRFLTNLELENWGVRVFCWGQPHDLVQIIFLLPIKVPVKMRPKAGEFFHRLNFGARRKFWEMNYNDGEIRCSCHIDTITAPLTESLFASMVQALALMSDRISPYVMAVFSGKMAPDFAADQAIPALSADSDEGDQSEAEWTPEN
jgi:hypothetical protein